MPSNRSPPDASAFEGTNKRDKGRKGAMGTTTAPAESSSSWSGQHGRGPQAPARGDDNNGGWRETGDVPCDTPSPVSDVSDIDTTQPEFWSRVMSTVPETPIISFGPKEPVGQSDDRELARIKHRYNETIDKANVISTRRSLRETSATKSKAAGTFLEQQGRKAADNAARLRAQEDKLHAKEKMARRREDELEEQQIDLEEQERALAQKKRGLERDRRGLARTKDTLGSQLGRNYNRQRSIMEQQAIIQNGRGTYLLMHSNNSAALHGIDRELEQVRTQHVAERKELDDHRRKKAGQDANSASYARAVIAYNNRAAAGGGNSNAGAGGSSSLEVPASAGGGGAGGGGRDKRAVPALSPFAGSVDLNTIAANAVGLVSSPARLYQPPPQQQQQQQQPRGSKSPDPRRDASSRNSPSVSSRHGSPGRRDTRETSVAETIEQQRREDSVPRVDPRSATRAPTKRAVLPKYGDSARFGAGAGPAETSAASRSPTPTAPSSAGDGGGGRTSKSRAPPKRGLSSSDSSDGGSGGQDRRKTSSGKSRATKKRAATGGDAGAPFG